MNPNILNALYKIKQDLSSIENDIINSEKQFSKKTKQIFSL